MAIRKSTGKSASKSASSEKSSGKGGFFSRIFKVSGRFLKILIILFWFLLGGLIFNLDRAGDIGIFILKYERFVPYPFSRFLPGAGASDGAVLPEQIIQGRVIRVSEGDTITVLTAHPEAKYKVRFFGIDAPESAMNHGSAAQRALQDKILGRDVTVRVVAVDHYGRAVGRVMIGSRYINLEMVADGHAWYYSDYARNEYDLATAEREARLQKRGLWQEKTPLPPWEFRNSKKIK